MPAEMKTMLVLLLTLAAGLESTAQTWSISINATDYSDLGTLNAEAGYAFGRHWNASAGFRYNPFSFRSDGEPFHRRRRIFSAGLRYWPWHVYSGWWLAGKLQYQEYNYGGLRSPQTREGERIGAGMTAGYAYMLTPWLNLEAGVGLWAGSDRFTIFSCPVCGSTEKQGRRPFLRPDDWLLALRFIF